MVTEQPKSDIENLRKAAEKRCLELRAQLQANKDTIESLQREREQIAREILINAGELRVLRSLNGQQEVSNV